MLQWGLLFSLCWRALCLCASCHPLQEEASWMSCGRRSDLKSGSTSFFKTRPPSVAHSGFELRPILCPPPQSVALPSVRHCTWQTIFFFSKTFYFFLPSNHKMSSLRTILFYIYLFCVMWRVRWGAVCSCHRVSKRTTLGNWFPPCRYQGCRIQVVRLSSKLLHPLSQLAGPNLWFPFSFQSFLVLVSLGPSLLMTNSRFFFFFFNVWECLHVSFPPVETFPGCEIGWIRWCSFSLSLRKLVHYPRPPWFLIGKLPARIPKERRK